MVFFMSEYKGYTSDLGKASMKYNKEHRENLTLNLAKGVKDEWKAQATSKGFRSLTEYIARLIENDK